MRKYGGYKPYHHELDIKPVPDDVNFINEPWIVDNTVYPPLKAFKAEDLIPDASDNVRVYVPLDLSKESILRRLKAVIKSFGEVNENNEVAYAVAVGRMLLQVEIYDQIQFVREKSGNADGHSSAAKDLMRDFVATLEDIPDGGAEIFPFELIDELKEEYGV